MEKQRKNLEVYNRTARQMAEKFNAIGARVKDIDILFSLLKNDNPKILEIGCGNGRDGKEIARKTPNYIGIDISEAMIEVAKEQAPEAHFEVADIEDFEIPKDLDAVVSFASLLHSDKRQIKLIIERVTEALKHGGIFYISLKKGLYEENGSDRNDEFGTRTYWFYTPEEIANLASERFDVLEIEEMNLKGQDWFNIILQKK